MSALAQPQARPKTSAGDVETIQNLKRQLLHLKKTTDHREYFDLNNMTMQQLEFTIKRVQDTNGLTPPINVDRGQRGRGRIEVVADNGSRPGDDWEVVVQTKKGAVRPSDEKKVLTFKSPDRKGMTHNILHGLFMYPDFLSPQEENQLLNFVNDQVAKGARRELAGSTYNKVKHMTAQLHYGVFYNIAENAPGGKQVEQMPEELNRIVMKLINEGILKQNQRPNTAVVSVMEEGDGMLPKIESKEFARPICTVSLLSDADMLFGDKGGQIEAHGIGLFSFPCTFPHTTPFTLFTHTRTHRPYSRISKSITWTDFCRISECSSCSSHFFWLLAISGYGLLVSKGISMRYRSGDSIH